MKKAEERAQEAFALITLFGDLILASDASEEHKEGMKTALREIAGLIGGAFGSVAAYEEIIKQITEKEL